MIQRSLLTLQRDQLRANAKVTLELAGQMRRLFKARIVGRFLDGLPALYGVVGTMHTQGSEPITYGMVLFLLKVPLERPQRDVA